MWHEYTMPGWHWKWLMTVDVPDTKRDQRQFIKFMTETFGPSSNNWSVRWCTLGADVRFHNQKDYFIFKMFHTIEPQID